MDKFQSITSEKAKKLIFFVAVHRGNLGEEGTNQKMWIFSNFLFHYSAVGAILLHIKED